jgi:hypothetical protein
MKFTQLFTKIPNYKRFGYTPRHFDPLEEERKEREERIRQELDQEQRKKLQEETLHSYRSRIAGSFKTAKKTATVQRDPTANTLRLIVLLIVTVGLIAFIQYGKVAVYGMLLVFIPLYLYLKYRKFRR